ncbi:MAG: cell division protein FtsA [Helicobacteraceae bacterium]|nr:cell division protein FtsA [Helicobacteraceae bacterium]
MSNILAIDIGSSKVCALIARIEDDVPTVIGSGVARSQGLKKGAIVNIENVAKAIKSAISDASRQAGIDHTRSIVSVSGAYASSVDSQGIASIPTKEITLKDINRAMQNAIYHASIPQEYDILHALPYNFKVDEQSDVQDPVGMSGSRLEMSVHIIITQRSSLENLKKAIEAAGASIENLVLSGYASALSVLNEEEKDLGVCVIDMGGATSNMIIHCANAPRYNDFLSVGGMNVTTDLSYGLHTTLSAAERIKIEYGSLITRSSATIDIPTTDSGTHPASLEVVSNVIHARVEETLMILASMLKKSQLKNSLGAGVVLTGGSSKHEGLADLASPIFENISVRVARPKLIGGMTDALRDPIYAVVLGLVRYGAGESTLYEFDSSKNLRLKANKSSEEEQHIQKTAQNDQHILLEKTNLADITTIPKPENVSLARRLKQFWEWLSKIF